MEKGRHREGRHCRWIHEWERLRGLEGGEMDLKKKERERERTLILVLDPDP